MSQSPLTPSRARGRKSMTAFARAPSQLSRSTSVNDFDGVEAEASTPTPPSQNAFATPPRRARRESGTPFKLTYSPFQTPPSGPSRSSSIPFDMAANARAARQAEAERLRVDNEALPKVKKQRFVRRKPLWKRMVSSPGDIVDSAILSIPSSVQEMLPPEEWANPLALVLYALHWVLLAPLRPAKVNDDVLLFRKGGNAIDDRWNRYEKETKVFRTSLAGWRMALLVTVLLFALSSANAFYLFTRFRSYDLQLCKATDPLASPNASPVPSPRAEERPSPQPTAAVYGQRIAHWGIVVVQHLYRGVLSLLGARPPATSATSRTNDIQSLRIWEPPEFCLAFFCAFPPPAPLITYLLTSQHPFLLPILHLSTAVLLTHLASSFHRLVKDRQVLYAQVQREYDQRFVYPRVFPTMADRAVGTSDSLLGP